MIAIRWGEMSTGALLIVILVYYDVEGWPRLTFVGSHGTYAAAAVRSRKLTRALIEAGEVGLKPHVGFRGEKPANFARNGVSL